MDGSSHRRVGGQTRSSGTSCSTPSCSSLSVVLLSPYFFVLSKRVVSVHKEPHRRTRHFFQMDINTTKLLFIFAVGISAMENFELKVTSSPKVQECNKTALHLKMEECGRRFKTDMAELDPRNWCNLTHFISEYHYFTSCTENNAVRIGCFWPHPGVEHYIILIHKQFFSNCTYTPIVWSDIPETPTLYILVTVTVFVTLAMVTSVVWCSKQR